MQQINKKDCNIDMQNRIQYTINKKSFWRQLLWVILLPEIADVAVAPVFWAVATTVVSGSSFYFSSAVEIPAVAPAATD